MSLTDTLVAARSRAPAWRPGLPAASTLLPYAVPSAILFLWEIAGATGLIPDTIMPRPSVILGTGLQMAASGELFAHLGVSALRALAGLAVGGAIGFALGVANGVSRLSETLTDASLQMIRNIPHLALIPLVILWFGIGEGAKLFLVALGVFFPIYLNTLHGIRNIDPQLIEMGRAYGMGPRQLFRRIVLPGALPSIFTGLRYGLGIMWLTLIVAETLSASSGLGYMAMKAREFMVLDVVVLSILLYAALGKLADTLTRALERRALQWSPAYANR